MNLTLIGIGAVGTVGIVIGIVSYIKNKSRDAARDALVIWGALGPFESGTESARAFKAASRVILGEPEEKLRRSFEEHKIAFDESPEEWEDSQRRAAAALERRHEPYLKKARMVLAEDAFNELASDFDLGYRANFTTTNDGRVDMGIVQTKPDGQIEKEREERDENIVTTVGIGLKSKKTSAGKELYDFVKELAKNRDDFSTDEDIAVGSVFLKLLTSDLDDEALTEHDSELIRRFTTLLIEDDLENNKVDDWRAYPGNRELLYQKIKGTKLIDQNEAITKEAIYEARKRDAEDYWALKEKFLAFDSEVTTTDFKTASKGYIFDLRESLSKLIFEMYKLGRPTKVMLPMAEKAYDEVIGSLKDNASSNETQLQALEEAAEKDEENRRIHSTELSNLIHHFPSNFREQDFAVLLLKSELEEFYNFMDIGSYKPLTQRALPAIEKIISKASEKSALADEIPGLAEKSQLIKKLK